MATLRIKVMAVADQSMGKIFAPLHVSAAKARAAVNGDMGKISSGAGKSAKDAAAKFGAAWGDFAKAAAKTTGVVSREAEKQARAQEQAIKRVERAREKAARDQQRAEERATKDAERQAEKRAKAFVSVARDFGGRTASNVGKVARIGLGIAGTAASSAGVDMSLGSLMNKGVRLETSVTNAVNSSAAADGRAGTREEVIATTKAIKEAANDTSTDVNAMADGLTNFIQRSSDLKTGTAILKDMGKIARATGTDVGEVMTAAGPIAKVFEGEANEAERVAEAMRLVAKQGAMGNVEIRELAPFMNRLASASREFVDVGHGGLTKDQALGHTSALAQIGMLGGRMDAAEASSGAAAFARDLEKHRTAKSFGKIMGADYNLYTDASKTTLKDNFQILKDVIKKTKGDKDLISQLFTGEASRSVVKGAANVYNEKGEKGLDELLSKLSTTMSKEDVDKAAKLSESTREAQATRFNNEMAEIADELSQKLIPALREAEPTIKKVASVFAGVVSWAAENPGRAITAAIIGSIAKAGLETALTSALKDLLTKVGRGGGGGGSPLPGGGGGGLGGGATGGQKVAGGIMAFLAGYQGTSELVDRSIGGKDTAEENRWKSDASARNLISASKTLKSFGSEDEKSAALAAAKQQQQELEDRLSKANDASIAKSVTIGGWSSMLNTASRGTWGTSETSQQQALQDKQHIVELRATIADLKGAIDAFGKKNITVVTSAPQGPPKVDQSATTGPGH